MGKTDGGFGVELAPMKTKKQGSKHQLADRWPTIILASASPRRATLLAEMGIKFKVVPGQVAEETHDYLSPSELVRLNARNKAHAVAAKYPGQLVLGADTVVCLGARVFGKPATIEEARSFLEQLQGQSHQVITGVCLICRQRHRERLFAVISTVRFRSLTSSQIDRYLEKVNPLDKAGAYAIQEHGEMIVEEISGSYSNVVGLPLERLQEELDITI